MVEKKTTKTPVRKPAVKKTAVKSETAPKVVHAPRKPAVKKAAEQVEIKVVSLPTKTPTNGSYHKAIGRRKEATARVRLIPSGKGIITVNGRPLEQYFTIYWDRQNIIAPLLAVGHNDDHDVSVKVEGGGIRGQSIAVRHGIARALLEINEDYRKTLRRAGFLTRDPRAKERKKPGLKRARKRGQWAKR